MSKEAMKQARSVISSINAGKQHALTKNGETVFWQREEWVRWALDEVLPLIDQAIAATEESSAVQERLELIGHADLAINNIYIFNGYGEDVPEGRTPIYAKYKQRKESEPQKSDDRIWPVELQGRLRDGQYSYDPAVEMSVFLKAVYWLENSPNTRDKAASKELRRLHEENIRLKDCLFQMQEAAKQLAAQPKAEKQEPDAYVSSLQNNSPIMCDLTKQDAEGLIALYTHPQPKAEPIRRGDILRCIETDELCTVWATSTTGKTLVKWSGNDFIDYTAEQIGELFWVEPRAKDLEDAAERSDNYAAFLAGARFSNTNPQPKREPLTIEQLREHWQVAEVLDMTDAEIDFADYVLIARDVEALYGIKE